MKINIVMTERIVELSEIESRLKRLKKFISNWYNVALISVGLFTIKIAAEQVVMIIIRGH